MRSLAISLAILTVATGCALPGPGYSVEDALVATKKRFGPGRSCEYLSIPSHGMLNDSIAVWLSLVRFPSGTESSIGEELRSAARSPGKCLSMGGPTPWRTRRALLGGLRRARGADLQRVELLYFGEAGERQKLDPALGTTGLRLEIAPPPAAE